MLTYSDNCQYAFVKDLNPSELKKHIGERIFNNKKRFNSTQETDHINQLSSASRVDSVAVFHQCPEDPTCPYCNSSLSNKSRTAFDWSFIDRAYCISLKSRNDRAASAASQFHKLGLCQNVEFYRPIKHPNSVKTGIWESHRAVAIDALNKGYDRILIMEDDVLYSRWLHPGKVKKISVLLDMLPTDWMIFFLGHWPLWAYFIRPYVIRTGSVCAHAYIASRRLMQWLNDHPYESSANVPKAPRIVGTGIDSAYSRLDKVYAMFPMLAIQSSSRCDNTSSKKKKLKLRHLIRHSKHREWLLSNLMRPNAFFVVITTSILFTLWRSIKRIFLNNLVKISQ